VRKDGYVAIPEDAFILLSNYIQEMEHRVIELEIINKALIEENERLTRETDALAGAIEVERQQFQITLEAKDRVIELQERQVEDLQFVYKYSQPSLWDKVKWAGGGAAVAAIIYAIAKTL
jgi:DNA-binding transcriptional regulator GbsR (MarR family)